MKRAMALAASWLLASQVSAAPLTPDDIVAKARPSEWQALDPADTLYMDLPAGRVVILLAPGFAPKTVAHIKQLVRGGYFNTGGAIIRVQDNYVVQWAKDPEPAAGKGWAEFDVPRTSSFHPLPDADGYAREAGFDGLFPAAGDGKREWLTHCYGAVGVGRDVAPDSGDGAELYAVIGQAPRQLDRNITLVGRVVQGMEYFTSLPRGHGPLGFYQKTEKPAPIRSLRVAADLPPAKQARLEMLRTDSPAFRAYVEARRNRSGPWYVKPAGHVDVCNVPLPVRPAR